MCSSHKCFGIFDLQTAGKIIGIIGVIVQTVGLLFLLIVGDFMDPITRSSGMSRMYQEDFGAAFSLVRLLFVLAIFGINILTNVLLISGSSNRKVSYILPFLICDMVMIVQVLPQVVLMMFTPMLFTLLFLGIFLYVIVKLYLWIVVYSLILSSITPTRNIQAAGVVYTQAAGVVYTQPPNVYAQPSKVYAQPPEQQSV